MEVSIGRLLTNYQAGLKYVGVLWREVLAPTQSAALERLAEADETQFVTEFHEWARIVYDFT